MTVVPRRLPLPRFVYTCRSAGRRRWQRARRRHRWLAQVAQAAARYQQADGRRLAAAVTYYGFFAFFALGLLGFAALGYIVDEPAGQEPVRQFLDTHAPRLDQSGLREARHATGLIGFASLPIVALLWVDSLRSSVRAIWRLEEYPGRFLTRWLLDGVVLTGLAVLLAVSLTVAFGAEVLLDWLLAPASGEFAPARWLLATARYGLGFGVDTLLSIAVLTLLPRLRMPLRRVLGPALLIAAGVAGLTTVGRLAVDRAAENPAFQVVAGAAGLLVFLLLLNQLILFAAALTAASPTGRVVDLATRRPVPGLVDTATRGAPLPARQRRAPDGDAARGGKGHGGGGRGGADRGSADCGGTDRSRDPERPSV